MRIFKYSLLSLTLGLLLGLWLGANVAKDQPLLSNPMAQPAVRERLKETGSTILRQSGKALEMGSEALVQGADALMENPGDMPMVEAAAPGVDAVVDVEMESAIDTAVETGVDAAVEAEMETAIDTAVEEAELPPEIMADSLLEGAVQPPAPPSE